MAEVYNRGMKRFGTVLLYSAISRDWSAEWEKIGCDKAVYAKLNLKVNSYRFWIKQVRAVVANILKQEALSKGGEAVVSRETMVNLDAKTDVLLSLNGDQLERFCAGLKEQPFQLPSLGRQLLQTVEHYESSVHEQYPQIMGILNVTPDSFSDGGQYLSEQAAVKHAQKMIIEGADIIDVGGESTRPGSKPVSTSEELQRVIPVIQALRRVNRSIQISIDTTKAAVAQKAIEAGATLVNDISGGLFDSAILKVVADCKVPYVIMHIPSRPEKMQDHVSYEDLLSEVYGALSNRVEATLKAGILRENLIVDPGIGFGKTTEQNLALLHRIAVFKGLGCRVLVGTSRKRFIGEILSKGEQDRCFGTAATLAISIVHGVNIVRAHDVQAMKDVVRMAWAIRKESVNA